MSNAAWRGEIDAGKTLSSGRLLKTADESSERNIREAIDIHPWVRLTISGAKEVQLDGEVSMGRKMLHDLRNLVGADDSRNLRSIAESYRGESSWMVIDHERTSNAAMTKCWRD